MLATMASILIRDVPDDVRAELAARAARKGQSMQEFLKATLVEMVAKPDIETWVEQVRRHRAEAEGPGTDGRTDRGGHPRDAGQPVIVDASVVVAGVLADDASQRVGAGGAPARRAGRAAPDAGRGHAEAPTRRRCGDPSRRETRTSRWADLAGCRSICIRSSLCAERVWELRDTVTRVRRLVRRPGRGARRTARHARRATGAALPDRGAHLSSRMSEALSSVVRLGQEGDDVGHQQQTTKSGEAPQEQSREGCTGRATPRPDGPAGRMVLGPGRRCLRHRRSWGVAGHPVIGRSQE